MSVQQIITVTCPACKGTFTSDYIQSANVTQDPDLLERILDLRLNLATCDHCNQKIYVDDFVLYNDINRRLFIFKYSLSDLEKWESILEERNSEWDLVPSELKQGPIEKRVVFGPFALKEKILLDRDGLDDKVIEIYKIGLLGELGAEFFNRTHRLYYFDTDEEDNLLFALVNIEQSTEVKLIKVPTETLDRFKGDYYQSIENKKLIQVVLEPPFISMEKVFFSGHLFEED